MMRIARGMRLSLIDLKKLHFRRSNCKSSKSGINNVGTPPRDMHNATVARRGNRSQQKSIEGGSRKVLQGKGEFEAFGSRIGKAPSRTHLGVATRVQSRSSGEKKQREFT